MTESESLEKVSTNVSSAMDQAGLMPDILDTSPSLLLAVQYGTKSVELGNNFATAEVKNPPTSMHWDSDPKKFYCLIMLDPDAPTRRLSLLRSFNHWMVGNIPGSIISDGTTLAEYRGSGPPPGTGSHRYVFLVYVQPKKLEFDEAGMGMIGRMRFSVQNFAKKYNLGKPIAGNFFLAAW